MILKKKCLKSKNRLYLLKKNNMNKLLIATSISLSVTFISCGDKPSEEIAENVTSEIVKDTTPITVNEETN